MATISITNSATEGRVRRNYRATGRFVWHFLEMVIGMAVWMRIRGHNRRSIGEMSAAMYLPFVVLLVPYGLGYLSGDAIVGAGHILMLPAMLIVMLARRHEYTGAHHRPRSNA